jgi:hypothetical protein
VAVAVGVVEEVAGVVVEAAVPQAATRRARGNVAINP